MNPERLESLLWERIDGAIAPDDLAVLQTHIDGHPEAESLQREVEGLAAQLDGLPRVAPPAGLRARIAAALPGDEALPRGPREHSAAPLPISASRWSVNWLPMAASLVIGVTVGYLLQPGAGVSVEDSRAAGTMIATATDRPEVSTHIDLGGRAGSLAITRTGTEAAISIDLASALELEVDLEAEGGGLLVTTVGTAASGDYEMEAAAGHARFRTRGPCAHTLEMTTASVDTPVHLVVSTNGDVIADQWLVEAGNRHPE
jgi:hypothetical protein